FLAADVRAGAPAQVYVEAQTAAQDIVAEQPGGAGRINGVGQPLGGQRILAPHIDVTVLRTNRERGDGHAFDDGKRIAFHDGAVLECARFRFVSIADDVVSASEVALS